MAGYILKYRIVDSRSGFLCSQISHRKYENEKLRRIEDLTFFLLFFIFVFLFWNELKNSPLMSVSEDEYPVIFLPEEKINQKKSVELPEDKPTEKRTVTLKKDKVIPEKKTVPLTDKNFLRPEKKIFKMKEIEVTKDKLLNKKVRKMISKNTDLEVRSKKTEKKIVKVTPKNMKVAFSGKRTIDPAFKNEVKKSKFASAFSNIPLSKVSEKKVIKKYVDTEKEISFKKSKSHKFETIGSESITKQKNIKWKVKDRDIRERVIFSNYIKGENIRVDNLRYTILGKIKRLGNTERFLCCKIEEYNCKIEILESGEKVSVSFGTNKDIPFEILSRLERKIPGGLNKCEK